MESCSNYNNVIMSITILLKNYFIFRSKPIAKTTSSGTTTTTQNHCK
jgi:hypothetical protein